MAFVTARGEEFRDDARRRKGLPPELIKRLTRIDPVRAALAVALSVGLVALTAAVAVTWWTPWVVLPAVLVMGALQHAWFVLAHDAAHYRLFERRWLNDLVGRSLATPGGVSMCTYRVVHRLHHNHLYEKQDPDLPLHGGYPRGKAYLLKKLAKDAAGLTAWKTYAYFFGAPAINDDLGAAHRPLNDTSPELRRAARRDRWIVAAFHLAAPVAAFAAGYGWQYLVLWVLPLLTVLPPILRFRAICEHGAVTDTGSPLKAARTNYAPAWLRWALFPHHVGYHLEHHLYPAIPHYNLPEAHRELLARGALDDAEVRRLGDTARIVMADRPLAVAAS
jgi:fatty acid desaturase